MSVAIDEAKALAEMKAVANEPMTLGILGGEMITLISAVQLACRHPNWTGQSREVVERLMRNWQNIIADPDSQMWRVLEAGWNPEYDTSSAGSGTVDSGSPPALPGERQAVDSSAVGSGVTKKLRSAGTRMLEMGRGNANVIRGMTTAIVEVVNRWIEERGPVDYIDMFMALHNAHCAVIFDLEEKTGDDKGKLRKMAIDTMGERFEREPNRSNKKQ